MAKKRIRGITVEIGGDTTKLDKALQGTNKYVAETEKKLKDVDRLLKLDPKNVELLDQKQRLLAQSVEATSTKYETLKKTAESATVSNVQFEKWEKAQVSIQRQITKTVNELTNFEKKAKELEGLGFAPDSSEMVEIQAQVEEAREKLDRLKASASETFEELGRPMSIDQWDSLQRELSETKTAADDAKDAFDGFNPTLSRFGSTAEDISGKAGKVADATRGVSMAAGGLLTAMLGSVKGTEEFRSDLSKLETNAQLAGVGLQSTEAALRQLNSVSDETDSSVEALSNLLQAGVTEPNLQRAVENLAGAAISFPDTVKIESLADSLQETLATGEATGQFAEVLDRLGVGTENFNTQLAQVPGEADKLNFALDTLQNQGLAGVYQAWTENNEALLENKDANFDLMQSLAELGEKMQPLMTTVTNLASAFLDWFNGLSEGQRSAVIALTAIVAAISPVAKAISSVSGAVSMVTQNLGGVKSAAASVFTFFTTNPMLAAVLAIAAAVALIALNWDDVKAAAGKTLNAIVDGASSALEKVDKFMFSLGGENWERLKQSALECFNFILGVISDVTDAIVGMWSKVWGGVKNVFSFGGGSSGSATTYSAPTPVSLDDLPHFAAGGVFAPNNPMLGVLGDNRTEYEVAAPESVLRDSFLDALSMSGMSGRQNVQVNVRFAGDLAQLGRVLQPLITVETARLGPSLAPR